MRQLARGVHYVTNLSGWMENPQWRSGNKVFDMTCTAIQKLPFSLHETLKGTFFDIDKVLAVSGESVVVARNEDYVDKFMFRYPAALALAEFKTKVEKEVGAVTRYLAPIALATTVEIRQAYMFKIPALRIPAVAQSQQRLNLEQNPALDHAVLQDEVHSPRLDKTVKDLEKLLAGADLLLEHHSYYPDVAHNSANLRRNVQDGTVTLTDVMPLYAGGGRLIGDNPPGVPERSLESLAAFREIVGQYGR